MSSDILSRSCNLNIFLHSLIGSYIKIELNSNINNSNYNHYSQVKGLLYECDESNGNCILNNCTTYNYIDSSSSSNNNNMIIHTQ